MLARYPSQAALHSRVNAQADLSSFRIIENPGQEMRDNLATMIDDNAHAPQPVQRWLMYQAPYVLIVTDHRDQIIAGAGIKKIQRNTAEFGFSIVQPAFRRMGLGCWMTQRRLNYAHKLGLSLVYSMVRENNLASRQNLKKCGFRHAGRYLHKTDCRIRIDWYVKSLEPLTRNQRNHLMRPVIRERVAVLY